MKIKKSLAFLLSFVLTLSCFPITSFAVEGLVGTDKAKLEFVYVKEQSGGEINNKYTVIEPDHIADEHLLCWCSQ